MVLDSPRVDWTGSSRYGLLIWQRIFLRYCILNATIIGTGHLGLVLGVCPVDVGHQIVCVDVDAAKVGGLDRGVIPIYEPGLEPVVKVGSPFLRKNDCMRPDRIAVRADDARAMDKLRQLHAPFNRNHNRTAVMDFRLAELTKYAADEMLATKISFMSEIANIAKRVGAEIEHVRRVRH